MASDSYEHVSIVLGDDDNQAGPAQDMAAIAAWVPKHMFRIDIAIKSPIGSPIGCLINPIDYVVLDAEATVSLCVPIELLCSLVIGGGGNNDDDDDTTPDTPTAGQGPAPVPAYPLIVCSNSSSTAAQ